MRPLRITQLIQGGSQISFLFGLLQLFERGVEIGFRLRGPPRVVVEHPLAAFATAVGGHTVGDPQQVGSLPAVIAIAGLALARPGRTFLGADRRRRAGRRSTQSGIRAPLPVLAHQRVRRSASACDSMMLVLRTQGGAEKLHACGRNAAAAVDHRPQFVCAGNGLRIGPRPL